MRPQHRDPAPPRRTARARRRTPFAAFSALGTALLVAAAALAGVVGVSSPASAAAQVSVSGTPTLEGESQLSLSGSGFQSVQGGFGGVYVLFGWVDEGSGWRPSNGGKTGQDYRYVYDDESNPTGYQLFVTFPGSSTASAANGGEIAADGTWSGTIRVPGARFTTYDRAQNETTVDCTEVQCGIITIGAHGVVNAVNETFTPVDFPAAAGGEDSGDEAAAGESGDDTAAEAEEGSDDTPAAATGDSGGSGDAASGQDVAVPATAGTAIDPQLIADQQRQQTLLTLLVAVGIVLALCVMALSFGIGGYLAMKALLLGVNPEALEKVRRKREERAVKAEHRRRRRVSDLRRREEIRSQRAEARNEGRTDRAARGAHGAGAVSAGSNGTTTDPWVSLEESAGNDAAPAAETAASARGGQQVQPWGGPALLQFFDEDAATASGTTVNGTPASANGTAGSSGAQNASTIVLDRVDRTGEGKEDS